MNLWQGSLAEMGKNQLKVVVIQLDKVHYMLLKNFKGFIFSLACKLAGSIAASQRHAASIPDKNQRYRYIPYRQLDKMHYIPYRIVNISSCSMLTS